MPDDGISLDLPGVGESAPLAAPQGEPQEPIVDVETLGKDLPGWKLAGNRLELDGAGHRAVLVRVSPPRRTP